MSIVRTVLGDIDPGELGVTDAHEHLVIAGGRPVQMNPDFLLADVELLSEELAGARALGLRSVIETMPADAGRDVLLLAELSRRTGLHIVAPTGLHHERYYHDRHWSVRLSVDEIADLFAADITDGIDALDYASPITHRTGHRAGVIKVAGSMGGPSARDARVFEAAAIAHRRTGCPIITHCEAGTGGPEQAAQLASFGVDLGHVALSHVDKIQDRGYHRELWASGVMVVYDHPFRWKDAPNGSIAVLQWAAEDGALDRVMLGLDAARQGYWTAYGGSPGIAYLVDGFAALMREHGLGAAEQERILVTNPARAYAFATSTGEEAA